MLISQHHTNVQRNSIHKALVEVSRRLRGVSNDLLIGGKYSHGNHGKFTSIGTASLEKEVSALFSI